MTDRIRHLTITLDRDYRDDDVKRIVDAIKMVRVVEHVEEHVVESSDQLARAAVRGELHTKMLEAVEQVFRIDRIRRVVADEGKP